jgi:putative hydrolase of the HAD superfamily
VPVRPRWIVFDAVGTLITPQPSVAEAYTSVGRRYGVDLPVEVVRQRFRTAFHESETACFAPQRRGQTSEVEELARWRWIVREVLPEAADAEACFRELWDHFAQAANWRCYDDVDTALTGLRQRNMNVAIASNFDERLQEIVRGFSVLAEVPRVFVSSALGARKPDPQFYRRIEIDLATDPQTLLMVGDDHQCDVLGPQQCGWQARRLHRSPDPDIDCWGSLGDLIDWLDHTAAA